jgi:nitroimidazol reductase NimA-like FMN-containing flavoprotein (pyridoxamine 5'-phosphate oxidase superfamily)
MLVREMSKQECYEFLKRQGFGRLACARDNQPYIVPIYFAYEPGRLYCFSTMGQKIEWMRSNPLVCVEIDEIQSRIEWSSLVLRGRYEEFPDLPEYATRREEAQTLLEKRSLWWQAGFAAAQTRRRFERDIPVFYCVRIEEISGRLVSADPVETSLGLDSATSSRRRA